MIRKILTIILLATFLLNAAGLSAFAMNGHNHLRPPAKGERLLDENKNGIDDLEEDLGSQDIQPQGRGEMSAAEPTVNAKLPTQETREKVIRIFEQLKSETGEDVVLIDKILDYYAYNLQTGRMRTDEIALEMSGAIRFQKRILSYQVKTTDLQGDIIESAEEILKDYLNSLGLTYQPVRIVFVSNEHVSSHVGGAYLSYYQTIVLSEQIDGEILMLALIHEILHASSCGFAPKKLDEGMTEYLMVKILMSKKTLMLNQGWQDFSFGSILNYYREKIIGTYAQKGSYVPDYAFELAAVLRLIDSIGEEPLLDAYFKGDQSQLKKILGSKIWQAIVEFAYQFESKRGIEVQAYLEGIKEIITSHQIDVIEQVFASPQVSENIKMGKLIDAIFRKLGGKNNGYTLQVDSYGIRIYKGDTQIMVLVLDGRNIKIYVNGDEYLEAIKVSIPKRSSYNVDKCPSPYTSVVKILQGIQPHGRGGKKGKGGKIGIKWISKMVAGAHNIVKRIAFLLFGEIFDDVRALKAFLREGKHLDMDGFFNYIKTENRDLAARTLLGQAEAPETNIDSLGLIYSKNIASQEDFARVVTAVRKSLKEKDKLIIVAPQGKMGDFEGVTVVSSPEEALAIVKSLNLDSVKYIRTEDEAYLPDVGNVIASEQILSYLKGVVTEPASLEDLRNAIQTLRNA